MEANDGRQAQGAYIPQELLKEISKVNNRLLIGIPRELEDIASVAGGNRAYETSHDRFLIGAV